ncbi:hypothetical protein SAMN05216196_10790 [Lutimaribacter pacificus]|uniref:Uncharacterized protein n=1 Tax=Lutimaribacter pacificus TaxID=391948 RepID=A0A1H0L0Y4_9RHOB|nr:hypothetical protein [Lutimaribacter pacificus]SDO61703.1 hypothetical protein SAMN05216196_10790 [Lutimaribacter pacificus]SHK72074.1 hypothetical protein SAMN05444142_10894 [Lutimaribacter pacificus]
MQKIFMLAGVGLLTTACVQATTEMDPLTAAISGKSIVAGSGAVVNVAPNGSLTGTLPNGTELEGAWTVRDGDFCRTLTAPDNLAGTKCQEAELGDGTVTLTDADGTSTLWTIQ